MIRCPKCSFEQPPDRYCARCGVNMETYTPPKASITRRLSGSSGFYVFLLLTVLTSTVYLIYNRSANKPAFLESMEAVSTATRPVPSPSQNAEKPQVESDTDKKEDSLVAAFNPTSAPLDIEAVELENAVADKETLFAAEPESAENTSLAGASPSKAKITVHFYEVPSAMLPLLAQDVASSGTLTNFNARLEELRRNSQGDMRAVSLTRVEKTVDTVGSPLQFDQIMNENFGLMVRVIPTAINDGSLNMDVQIESRGNFLTPGAATAGTQIQDFEGSFQLANGSAAYFVDTLTRVNNPRQEDLSTFSRHPVYKVLASPLFQNNASEFFVFFEVTGINERP